MEWSHPNNGLLCSTSVETVVSIYMQQVKLRVKRNHHLLKEAVPSYARRFAAGTHYLGPACQNSLHMSWYAGIAMGQTCLVCGQKQTWLPACSCVGCLSRPHGHALSRQAAFAQRCRLRQYTSMLIRYAWSHADCKSAIRVWYIQLNWCMHAACMANLMLLAARTTVPHCDLNFYSEWRLSIVSLRKADAMHCPAAFRPKHAFKPCHGC